MIVKRAYLVAALAVLSVGLAANASTLEVRATFPQASGESVTILTSAHPGVPQYTSVNVWQFTNVQVNVVGTGDLFGSQSNVALNTTADALTAALVPGFSGVCIDALHDVNWGHNYLWTVDSLDAMISRPVNGVPGGLSTEQVHAIAYLWQHNYSSGNAAAFQMAVWDVIYGDVNGLITDSNGGVGYLGVCSTSGDASIAKGWAQIALDNNDKASTGDMYVLWGVGVLDVNDPTKPPPQDFTFAIVSGTSVVPLPSSVGMGLSMLAGLGCVFGLRKRMQRSV